MVVLCMLSMPKMNPSLTALDKSTMQHPKDWTSRRSNTLPCFIIIIIIIIIQNSNETRNGGLDLYGKDYVRSVGLLLGKVPETRLWQDESPIIKKGNRLPFIWKNKGVVKSFANSTVSTMCVCGGGGGGGGVLV